MKRLGIIAAMVIAAIQAAPASAATFLFIRHAESAANAQTVTTVQDVVDPPLTARGQQQALDLSQTLASYDIRTIYTSAYQRTQATIAPTATALGLSTITDARTNEWYMGDAQTLAEYASADLQGVIRAWGQGDTAAKPNLPNAESLDDMAARVIPAWTDIINRHKDDDGVVVLVGHSAETGYVMPYFAKNVPMGYGFANGLHNTGIVELKLINDQPYVTNWQGTFLAVPEPATWMMLLLGFGVIGTAVRRAKATQSATRLALS